MITIRPYTPDDALPLLGLFRETVRRVNCHDYSPAQIAAWASDDISLDAWTDRFRNRITIVAEVNGQLSGFTDLEFDGHIDRFYVSADCQRSGVGRRLMEALFTSAHERQLQKLSAEVSITARPFFERMGFVVIAPQEVTVRGLSFVNYRMTCQMLDGATHATNRPDVTPDAKSR